MFEQLMSAQLLAKLYQAENCLIDACTTLIAASVHKKLTQINNIIATSVSKQRKHHMHDSHYVQMHS